MYSHKSLYRPKKQTGIIFAASRTTGKLFEANLSHLSALEALEHYQESPRIKSSV